MLAIDLVRFCGEMLKRLSDCDILLDDYKRVGMCDMMEEIEGGENTMNERGMYRDEMYERGMNYRRGGRYRDGRYNY